MPSGATNSNRIGDFPVVVSSGYGYLYLTLTDASDVLTTSDEIRFRLTQAFDVWHGLYSSQTAQALALAVDDDMYFSFEDKTLKCAGYGYIAYGNGMTITTEVEGSEV
jgi:hypothetical protein